MTNGKDSLNWHGTSGNGQETIENTDYNKIKNLGYRERILLKAKNKITQNLIKELYKENSELGDGGTADALINEAKTGNPTKGKYHKIKAEERISQINRILKKGLAPGDENLIRHEKEKLEQALKLWREKNKK